MKKKEFIFLVVLLISIIFVPILFSGSNYYLSLTMLILTFVLVANALNIVVGFGGMLSLGHAGFLLIGSYTFAVIMNAYETLPFPLVIVGAGIISALVGLIVGLPAMKLKGHFLAVATLGFGLCVPKIILNFPQLTNGYNGLSLPNHVANMNVKFYILAGIILLCILVLILLLNSNIGKIFLAIKDSEVASASVGIHVEKYKVIMFALSAFFAGIAGATNAYWIGFVSVDDYSLMTSFFILAMVIVGGKGNIIGVTLGAIIFTVIPHFTDNYVGLTNIIIGLFVVVITLALPNGLLSFPRKKVKKVEPIRSEVTSLD